MKSLVLRTLSIILVLNVSAFAKAQSIAEIRFEEMLEKMPRLPARYSEALEEYKNLTFGDVPVACNTAVKEFEEIKKGIYKPLFDYFQDNLKKANADKSFRLKLNPEEQIMLRDFGTLDASWGDGAYYAFSEWIEYRPGISKQSWTKVAQPLSANGRVLYQQLLQLEKALTTANFLNEVRPRKSLFLSIRGLDAISKQLAEDLEAVPMKKVKLFEGSDALAEVRDPKKSIEVFEKYGERVQAAHKQSYEEEYGWWNAQCQRVSTIALKMDSVLMATSFGKELSGADQQLKWAIADVQGRIMEQVYHLTTIEGKIAGIVSQANMGKQMTEESINDLRKLPAQ